MPWYLSWYRVSLSGAFAYYAFRQLRCLVDAEDRYRRSLTWKSAVATVVNHNLLLSRGGASRVTYTFDVDGTTYTGQRFCSGGVWEEEVMSDPQLLGVGTQMVVYYNPANPHESAMTLRRDRGSGTVLCLCTGLSLLLAYRAVRCETIMSNMYYRLLSVNRRAAEWTGMPQARHHALEKMKYGKQSGAV